MNCPAPHHFIWQRRPRRLGQAARRDACRRPRTAGGRRRAAGRNSRHCGRGLSPSRRISGPRRTPSSISSGSQQILAAERAADPRGESTAMRSPARPRASSRCGWRSTTSSASPIASAGRADLRGCGARLARRRRCRAHRRLLQARRAGGRGAAARGARAMAVGLGSPPHRTRRGTRSPLRSTVRANGIIGFLALRTLSSLTWLRRRGTRYAQEQAMIERWLAAIAAALASDWRVAHEIALCGRLVKGYGATNERGKRNLAPHSRSPRDGRIVRRTCPARGRDPAGARGGAGGRGWARPRCGIGHARRTAATDRAATHPLDEKARAIPRRWPDDVDDRTHASAGEARIDAATLTRAVERMFVAAGCERREARQVADGLVEANLYGHDSHGVGLVPRYLENLEQGLVLPGRTARVVADHGAIVGLDGDKGFGQAIGEQAMRIAIERARAHGLAMVGLANTHHLARIGRWGEQCAAAGFASVHFVNVLSQPLVAPWGGLRRAARHQPVLRRRTACAAPAGARLRHQRGRLRQGARRARHRAEDGRRSAARRAGPADRRSGRDVPGSDRRAVAAGRAQGIRAGRHVRAAGRRAVRRQGAGPRTEAEPDDQQHAVAGVRAGQAVRPRRLRAAGRAPGRVAARLAAGAVEAGIHLPGEPERIAARERERLGIPLPRRTRDALQACAVRLHVTDVDFVASCAPGGRG